MRSQALLVAAKFLIVFLGSDWCEFSSSTGIDDDGSNYKKKLSMQAYLNRPLSGPRHTDSIGCADN